LREARHLETHTVRGGGPRCCRPFWQGTSRDEHGSAVRKTANRTALGGRCRLQYTALRTAQSDYSAVWRMGCPKTYRWRVGHFGVVASLFFQWAWFACPR
jgi:hypothetical protein